jgi:thioredoxin reductase
VHQEEKGFALELKTGEEALTLQADAVVLATGMRSRATPVLTELAQSSPRVIVGPLSLTIRDDIRSSQVLILGGGDNALDHALFLSERGNTVTVCTRGVFSARLQFREACAGQTGVTLRQDCRPSRFRLEAERIVARWPDGEQAFNWLLVMYGYEPNTEIVERFDKAIRPRRTKQGHIVVDLWQRSSVAGIYAAGDITDSPQPSVATAIAQGLATARAVERDLSKNQ